VCESASMTNSEETLILSKTRKKKRMCKKKPRVNPGLFVQY